MNIFYSWENVWMNVRQANNKEKMSLNVIVCAHMCLHEGACVKAGDWHCMSSSVAFHLFFSFRHCFSLNLKFTGLEVSGTCLSLHLLGHWITGCAPLLLALMHLLWIWTRVLLLCGRCFNSCAISECQYSYKIIRERAWDVGQWQSTCLLWGRSPGFDPRHLQKESQRKRHSA